jgi:hypothetical protein
MSETAPLALTQLDQMNGSRTAEAFSVATKQHPHLEGLAVILHDKGAGEFQSSELGLGGSYIGMNPDQDALDKSIQSGLVTARMKEFSVFYRERGILPRKKELITSIFLHELGHAEDFHQYTVNAGGDVKAAFNLSNEVRRSQLITLPLGGASSRARRDWENNTENYRDRMIRHGYTDETFATALLKNSEAYAQLPCEKVADRFALGVLATMYA